MRSYPQYMYPRKEWHRIPHHNKLNKMMVVRLMRKTQMPPNGKISGDDMATAMRESEFCNGISVNLLYKYKKRDTVWWVDDRNLTADWDFVTDIPCVDSQRIMYYKKQGYFGFKIEDMERLRSTCQIYNNKGEVQRTDGVRCKVVHSPNNVNFWHYNIYLYGEETTGDGKKREYLLRSEVNEKRVKSVASEMMDDFYRIIKTKKRLHVHCLPKAFYKRCKKWEIIKNELIQKGIINSKEQGF